MVEKFCMFAAVSLTAVGVGGCHNPTGLAGGGDTQVVGSGNLVTQTRAVSDFDAISFAGAGQVIIEQNGTESLTITAEDNILSHLTSHVVDSRLVIDVDNGVRATRDMVFHVTVAGLRDLVVGGAGVVEATGLDTDTLGVAISGAFAVTTSGRADAQFVNISGAAAYGAEGLESRVAEVTASGATVVVVRVSERLEAQVSGAAAVEYIGDPEVVFTISGAGTVRKRP